MKVVMVAPYFYPKSGGLENYVYNISKGLKEKYSWDVVIITANHNEKKYEREVIDGIIVFRLPILMTLSNTPINPLWYFQIKEILYKEKPDIINAHSPVPFIADITRLVCGKIPFFVTYHAGTMKKGKYPVDWLINLYETLFLPKLFKRADKIICSSNFVLNTIVKKYAQKSIVVTPGVDTSIFRPSKHKDNSLFTILFVCRYANMYKMKGLFILIEAVQRIKNIKLRVVGEIIQNKWKNVEFVGIKSEGALAKEMQNSSIVALTPLAAFESFGMVLIEAMACSTAVIGSNIGGIPEVITNNREGLVIPPNNINALIAGIKFLTEKPGIIKKMGENGYEKVLNNYTWDKKVAILNNLFKTNIS